LNISEFTIVALKVNREFMGPYFVVLYLNVDISKLPLRTTGSIKLFFSLPRKHFIAEKVYRTGGTVVEHLSHHLKLEGSNLPIADTRGPY
jgi:hypothetical protein